MKQMKKRITENNYEFDRNKSKQGFFLDKNETRVSGVN